MLCSLRASLRSIRRCTAAVLLLCGAALLSFPASAQNPLQRYPQNYKLIFDNPQISVIRVHYSPHESVGVHDHSDLPTLFVYLNDSGRVQFRMEGIPPSVLVRQPAKLGSFRYSPGQLERHSVKNLSDTSSDFLRIELKQFPLQGGEAFRKDPPTSFAASRTEKEFANNQVEVERVICLGGATCPLDAASEPSVLIALSQASVSGFPEHNAAMNTGDIRWMEANQQAIASAPASEPAQFLRVFVEPAKRTTPISWRQAHSQ
jgi:hypothetical protein